MSFAAFRSVPRTGVIFVTSEAERLGYRASDPGWCDRGQGQPDSPMPQSMLSSYRQN